MQDYVVPAAAAVVLMLIWAGEGLAPLLSGRRHRTQHAARNLALGLSNGLLRAAIFPPLLLAVTLSCQQDRFGLLHTLELPLWASFIGAVLLLDLWQYMWHVLWHKVPYFWRFHVVHHHDPEVDASTAFRFHAGEILLSSFVLVMAVPIFGVTLPQIVVFEALLITTAIFHHANIRLPEQLDRALRLVLVTPRMHWVHHSRWEPETDSNYSAIFSFWDRLFGTYRVHDDLATLSLGIDGYEHKDTCTLSGLIATPIGPIKSQFGTPPAGAEPPASNGGCRSSTAGGTALATPSTHPTRGRHLPVALAVAHRLPQPRGPGGIPSGAHYASGP
jgi:sterol desaturase/sphingolipid hydroxylase (fatty acid hydroxylase superfamily)